MRRVCWALALSALFATVARAAPAPAATLRSIGSFDHPIFVTSDPSDSSRLLVVEREGRLVEIGPNGGIRTIADLSSLVSCCNSERGLLSIAPAPDFHASGRFYAAYTGTPAAGGQEGDVHVDAFLADPADPIHLPREPLLTVGHAENANHNGGQLEFGPDGLLYVSVGDGGGAGDVPGNAQNTEVLLGKLLRLQPRPGQFPAYTIPPGNPFLGKAGRDEIWAYGLRNPWRFSFDYATGDMIVADVGQGEREEIDFAPFGGGLVTGAGANYGWNCREGSIAYPGAPGSCTGTAGFTEPVFDYPHEDPGGGVAHGCSIIGGYVVRDRSVPGLYGRYVYTDYCTGQVRSLLLPATASGRASDDRAEGLTVSEPTSFGEDACGRVYVASDQGTVFRLEGPQPAVCPQPATAPLAKTARKKKGLVRLRVRRGRSGPMLIATVVPCAGHGRARLQLNRGGRRFSAKRLSRRCVARFRPRVRRRATFRALLPGGVPIRSRPVELGAGR